MPILRLLRALWRLFRKLFRRGKKALASAGDQALAAVKNVWDPDRRPAWIKYGFRSRRAFRRKTHARRGWWKLYLRALRDLHARKPRPPKLCHECGKPVKRRRLSLCKPTCKRTPAQEFLRPQPAPFPELAARLPSVEDLSGFSRDLARLRDDVNAPMGG